MFISRFQTGRSESLRKSAQQHKIVNHVTETHLVFALSEEDYSALVDAVYLVAGVIKCGLGVTRVGVFFEGFEIDYTHAKLIPVYGDDPPPSQVVAPPALFWMSYPGFVTTQPEPGPLEKDMSSLNALADGVCKCLASSLGPNTRFPD
jgi:hypothetical protein